MTKSKLASAGGGVRAACALVMVTLGACGGPTKPADAPGTCPDGTVLRGSDCVASTAESDSPASKPPESEIADTPSPKRPSDPDKAASAHGGSASTTAEAPAGGKTPYDRDSVEVELKRGARQVKANCGAATDDEGKATGPWGRTKATVVLGRNGHVRRVTLPEPYDGKPVAVCVGHSFEKILFPPYAAPADVSVDWDVDIVQPKGH